jgi:hypothetical protein
MKRLLLAIILSTTAHIGSLMAQSGATCAQSVLIPSLPFVQNGRTTCGNGDTYTSADACGSIYMDGDDFVYRYVSPGNEQITIALTNTDLYTGVFLMDGCPSAGPTNCMPLTGGAGSCMSSGATNESWAGDPFGTWNICNSGTYYILISTWPSPQCTPFNITVTRTATNCGGGSAPALCYNRTTPAYTPDNLGSGTAVTFLDDEFSATTFPIGFNFCYNGTVYNQFVISSNGFLSFNASCAGQYSDYVVTPIPNTSLPDISNAVLGNWSDLDPSVTGTIRYQNYGAAPNRRLSVSFRNVALFDCNAMRFFGQIVLYETSNNIAYFIQDHPVCTTWNNGDAVQGITNVNGTQAMATAGRNSTNWTATNDAQLYSPTCAPCLVVFPVKYLYFKGVARNGVNELAWVTTQETDMDHFVLERSMDGRDFQAIGTIGAQGSASSGGEYKFTDRNPNAPFSYYRLLEVDQNGGVSYSETVILSTLGNTFGIQSVKVNQQDQSLNVVMNIGPKTEKITLEVFDVSGRKLQSNYFSMNQGRQEAGLNLAGMAAGTYLLSATDGNGTNLVRRFVIY